MTYIARWPAPAIAAWTPAAITIAFLALLGVAAAVWWSVGPGRERPGPDYAAHPEGAPRIRRRPQIEPWMVASLLLLVAGVIIAPRLLGFTFLFLPLLFGRRRRGPGTGGGRDRARDEPDSPYGG
jgi:hypothetical protein